MAKITRQLSKVFGNTGATGNFGKFGSRTAGATVYTKNVVTIQSLTAWEEGWQDAVLAVNKAPFLEDMNALCYVLSYQVSYLLQDGIPEWNSATSYYIGSIVRKVSTGELYRSLTDDNVGNALPSLASNANWAWQNPSGPGSGLDADTVDSFHASDVPTADTILPLDGDAMFPESVIPARDYDVVKVSSTVTGATNSGAGTIPNDDSIPQVGEGNLWMTLAHTPEDAANLLRVDVTCWMSVGDSNRLIAALFKDGAANAVAAGSTLVGNSNALGAVTFTYWAAAGGTAAQSWTVRGGGQSGAGSAAFNGVSTGRLFGGVLASSITITEYKAP